MPIVVNVNDWDLFDLGRRYTCLSFHQQSTCVSSPPVHRVHACVRVGGGGLVTISVGAVVIRAASQTDRNGVAE